MTSFEHLLLLLSATVAVNADKAWTLGRHIFLFRDEMKSWEAAKNDCESMNLTLAKVDSPQITNSIINARVSKEVWIGAHRSSDSTQWIWLDGTTATYQNWKANEPSLGDEMCVLVQEQREKKWNDFDCSNRNVRFLCQGSLRFLPDTDTVNVDSASSVTCSADGNPSSVSWRHGWKKVAITNSGAVYQVQSSGKSILYVGNAQYQDKGIYECQAYEFAKGRSLTRRRTLTVSVPHSTVPHSPIRVDAVLVNCSNKIIVKVQPNKRASYALHSIAVYRSGGQYIKGEFKYARGTRLQKIAEMDLPPWTGSTVFVGVCTRSIDCRGSSKSTTIHTKGLPRNISRIDVSPHGSFTCNVDWEYPNHESKEHIILYRITWNETISSGRSGSSNSFNTIQTEVNGSAASYVLHGKPNSKYKVAVQAKTCAGFGNLLWSNQDCITDSKAPETLKKPTVPTKSISSHGTLNITVYMPSQENGKISCVFVIVRIQDKENVSESKPHYSVSDLIRANTSNNEYIAISYQVTDATQAVFLLGDAKTSQCYVSAGIAKRQKRDVNGVIFVGQNAKLLQTRTYSIFIVSASPTRSGYVVKASDSVQVTGVVETNENAEREQSLTGIIVGPILGFTVILIVVVMLLLVRLHRKKRMTNVEEPQYAGIGAQPDNAYAMANDVVYQNSGEVPAIRKRTGTDVHMKEFENVYNSMHNNKGVKFSEQFAELTRTAANVALTKDFASNPKLKGKNRYKNILPFDATRVPIHHNDDGYINACFVDGHEITRKFIATQGPVKKTVNDFWIMVVEQNCTEIVMLAKCVEGGKTKCEKYWPDLGDTVTFGEVKVSNLNETLSCGFVCRSLKISANWKEGSTDVMVSQFHFLRWPDHGFPITTSYILQMHGKCMETWERNGAKTPIVVHCSAGAGRSGTFIGYDIVLNERKSIGNADVFECVAKMRQQRMEMVQNCDQYILVHKLLLESHLFGSTDILGRDVSERFSNTQYKNVVIAEQFKNLPRVKPLEMSQKDTTEKMSTYERMAVKLWKGGKDILKSLGASYVEAYDESVSLLITREPAKSNLEGFWKLIFNDDVSTIVMITEHKNEVFTYWNEQYHFTVAVTHEEIVNTTTIRKLRISGKDYAPKTVTHIHLKLASRGSDVQNIAKINESVRRVQTQIRESKGAALVHCKNGIGMSGVYCTIMNLLERLKLEDRADVFRTVKDLRDCKNGMIQTVEQFRLCHKAVLEYLRNFDTYSNFK